MCETKSMIFLREKLGQISSLGDYEKNLPLPMLFMTWRSYAWGLHQKNGVHFANVLYNNGQKKAWENASFPCELHCCWKDLRLAIKILMTRQRFFYGWRRNLSFKSAYICMLGLISLSSMNYVGWLIWSYFSSSNNLILLPYLMPD